MAIEERLKIMTDIKAKFNDYKKTFDTKSFILEFILFGIILSADLISKEYLSAFLLTQPNHSYPFINGFMDLVFVKNFGASFGILTGKSAFLIAFVTIALILIALLWVFYARNKSWAIKLSLVFFLAGGIGNLVDRIMLGYVRDFLHFQFFEFPVFNIADSFVVVGSIILIIALIVDIAVEYKNKARKKNG